MDKITNTHNLDTNFQAYYSAIEAGSPEPVRLNLAVGQSGLPLIRSGANGLEVWGIVGFDGTSYDEDYYRLQVDLGEAGIQQFPIHAGSEIGIQVLQPTPDLQPQLTTFGKVISVSAEGVELELYPEPTTKLIAA